MKPSAFGARALLLAVLALLVSACQETTSTPLAGSGKLILSPEAAAVVVALDKDVGQLRFQRFVAVDAGTGFWGATFCEENAPAQCLSQSDGPLGSDAVSYCQDKGGRDCRILYSRGEIIWEGPVLRRKEGGLLALPYHGAWPVDVAWPDQATGSGRLIGTNGRFAFEGFRPLDDCALKLGWTKSDDPALNAECADGEKVTGRLVQISEGHLELVGQSEAGAEVRITIQVGTGTALPAAYRKRGAT
jgi:hypothetical protein